jgi:hypothetical protein
VILCMSVVLTVVVVVIYPSLPHSCTTAVKHKQFPAVAAVNAITVVPCVARPTGVHVVVV